MVVWLFKKKKKMLRRGIHVASKNIIKNILIGLTFRWMGFWNFEKVSCDVLFTSQHLRGKNQIITVWRDQVLQACEEREYDCWDGCDVKITWQRCGVIFTSLSALYIYFKHAPQTDSSVIHWKLFFFNPLLLIPSLHNHFLLHKNCSSPI